MVEVALEAAVDASAAVRSTAVRLVANKLYQMQLLTSRVSPKALSRPFRLACLEESSEAGLRASKLSESGDADAYTLFQAKP